MKSTIVSTDNESAPLFKRWTVWYALVLVFLVLCIGALYWFTKHFS